jgi:hypothetical protein
MKLSTEILRIADSIRELPKVADPWTVKEETLSDKSIVYNVTNGEIVLHANNELNAHRLVIALQKYCID